MTLRILPPSLSPVAHTLDVIGISFFDEDVVLLPYRSTGEGVYCLVCIKKSDMADAVLDRGQHSSAIQTPREQKRIFLFNQEAYQTKALLKEVAQSLPIPEHLEAV